MIKLIGGAEGAAGAGEVSADGDGAKTNLNKARMIRVFNGHTADVLISVKTSAGVLVGTFTLSENSVEYVQKDNTDTIFAGHASVKFANISHVG